MGHKGAFADRGWVGGALPPPTQTPNSSAPSEQMPPQGALGRAAPRPRQVVLLRFCASVNGSRRCPDKQLCHQPLIRHAAIVPVRSDLSGADIHVLGLPPGPPHPWPSPPETGFWVLDPPMPQGGLGSGNSGSRPWCSCHPLSWGITCERLRAHQLCPPSPAAPTQCSPGPSPRLLASIH